MNACYNQCCGLRRLGHEVTVCTSDAAEDSLVEAASVQGVHVVRFPTNIDFSQFKVTPAMKEWVSGQSGRFDIVHLHGFRTYQNIVAARHASRQGLPFVLQPHGTYPRILEKKIMKLAFDMVWGQGIIRRCSRVIAVSRKESRALVSDGVDPDRIEVIPNGIADDLQNLSRRGRFRDKIGVIDKKIVLFVGRIHRIKGIDLLVEAFSRVHGQVDEVQLVIVGPDDGHKRNLESRIASLGIRDRVTFVDFIEDVREAYADSDVVVYPGSYEIFGMVPFEALLSGVPVIVTRSSGCGEIVDEVGCGHVLEQVNPDALAQAIEHVLQNPEESLEETRRGMRFVKENLNWDGISRRLVRVYTDCINHSGQTRRGSRAEK